VILTMITIRLLLKVCGLYYNPITIINDDSSIINKLETSLIDDARVVIYDRHMFIVQATGVNAGKFFFVVTVSAESYICVKACSSGVLHCKVMLQDCPQ
jgi:hypothetical protein